jgi:vancomycin aglycone glucosyltransferase
LAADSTLAPWLDPANLEVVVTGGRILPDERPLATELVAFLDAGTRPVYAGFGSMGARNASPASPPSDPRGDAGDVQGRRSVAIASVTKSVVAAHVMQTLHRSDDLLQACECRA